MTEQGPPRYPYAARERFGVLFGLRSDEWMQDWPLEVSDPSRLKEFVDGYQTMELNEVEKFALMELILFSLEESDQLDEWLYGWHSVGDNETLLRQIERLLCRDFLLHLHTVNYWRCADEPETDPDTGSIFQITPMMRRIWDKYYRPEYARWLDEPDDTAQPAAYGQPVH
jgi:hypothetical protein